LFVDINLDFALYYRIFKKYYFGALERPFHPSPPTKRKLANLMLLASKLMLYIIVCVYLSSKREQWK